MNLLTGKAKEDFEKWLQERNCNLYDMIRHRNIDAVVVSAYIIEWLDSVGIYIQVGAISTHGQPIFDYNIQEDNTINGMNGHTFPSRHEATKEAIKQANKIYNETNRI